MRPAGVKSNPFLLTGAAPNAVPPCWQRLCAAPLRKTALHYHVLEIQTRSLASVICLSWLGYRSPAWGSSGRRPAAAEPACPRMDVLHIITGVPRVESARTDASSAGAVWP